MHIKYFDLGDKSYVGPYLHTTKRERAFKDLVRYYWPRLYFCSRLFLCITQMPNFALTHSVRVKLSVKEYRVYL